MHVRNGAVHLKESTATLLLSIFGLFPMGFRGLMAVSYGNRVFVKTNIFLSAHICENQGSVSRFAQCLQKQIA